MNNLNQDKRQYAPATERNRSPILQVLQQFLPPEGVVLEIAAGTGQHANFLVEHFPKIQWYPSDPDPICRDSIQAWRSFEPKPNLQLPLNIDVSQDNWWEKSPAKIKAIVCINMVHISPWSAFLGLIKGAELLLEKGGLLYLYGPYFQKDKITAPSNLEFDRYLRTQNANWGLRNLEEVVLNAEKHRLNCIEIVEMPANNLSLILQKY
jgi:Protein of unknown function (DUF938)